MSSFSDSYRAYQPTPIQPQSTGAMPQQAAPTIPNDAYAFQSWIRNHPLLKEHKLSGYESIDQTTWDQMTKLRFKARFTEEYEKTVIPALAQGNKQLEASMLMDFRTRSGNPSETLRMAEEIAKSGGTMPVPPGSEAALAGGDAAASTEGGIGEKALGVGGKVVHGLLKGAKDFVLGTGQLGSYALGKDQWMKDLAEMSKEADDVLSPIAEKADKALYNSADSRQRKADFQALQGKDGMSAKEVVQYAMDNPLGATEQFIDVTANSLGTVVGALGIPGLARKKIAEKLLPDPLADMAKSKAAQVATMGGAVGISIGNSALDEVAGEFVVQKLASAAGYTPEEWMQIHGEAAPGLIQKGIQDLTPEEVNAAQVAGRNTGIVTAALTGLSAGMGGTAESVLASGTSAVAGVSAKRAVGLAALNAPIEALDETNEGYQKRSAFEDLGYETPAHLKDLTGMAAIAAASSAVSDLGGYGLGRGYNSLVGKKPPVDNPTPTPTAPNADGTNNPIPPPPGTPPTAAPTEQTMSPLFTEAMNAAGITDEIDPETGEPIGTHQSLWDSTTSALTRHITTLTQNPEPGAVATNVEDMYKTAFKLLNAQAVRNGQQIDPATGQPINTANRGEHTRRAANALVKQMLEVNGLHGMAMDFGIKNAHATASKGSYDGVFDEADAAVAKVVSELAVEGEAVDPVRRGESIANARLNTALSAAKRMGLDFGVDETSSVADRMAAYARLRALSQNRAEDPTAPLSASERVLSLAKALQSDFRDTYGNDGKSEPQSISVRSLSTAFRAIHSNASLATPDEAFMPVFRQYNAIIKGVNNDLREAFRAVHEARAEAEAAGEDDLSDFSLEAELQPAMKKGRDALFKLLSDNLHNQTDKGSLLRSEADFNRVMELAADEMVRLAVEAGYDQAVADGTAQKSGIEARKERLAQQQAAGIAEIRRRAESLKAAAQNVYNSRGNIADLNGALVSLMNEQISLAQWALSTNFPRLREDQGIPKAVSEFLRNLDEFIQNPELEWIPGYAEAAVSRTMNLKAVREAGEGVVIPRRPSTFDEDVDVVTNPAPFDATADILRRLPVVVDASAQHEASESAAQERQEGKGEAPKNALARKKAPGPMTRTEPETVTVTKNERVEDAAPLQLTYDGTPSPAVFTFASQMTGYLAALSDKLFKQLRSVGNPANRDPVVAGAAMGYLEFVAKQLATAESVSTQGRRLNDTLRFINRMLANYGAWVNDPTIQRFDEATGNPTNPLRKTATYSDPMQLVNDLRFILKSHARDLFTARNLAGRQASNDTMALLGREARDIQLLGAAVETIAFWSENPASLQQSMEVYYQSLYALDDVMSANVDMAALSNNINLDELVTIGMALGLLRTSGLVPAEKFNDSIEIAAKPNVKLKQGRRSAADKRNKKNDPPSDPTDDSTPPEPPPSGGSPNGGGKAAKPTLSDAKAETPPAAQPQDKARRAPKKKPLSNEAAPAPVVDTPAPAPTANPLKKTAKRKAEAPAPKAKAEAPTPEAKAEANPLKKPKKANALKTPKRRDKKGLTKAELAVLKQDVQKLAEEPGDMTLSPEEKAVLDENPSIPRDFFSLVKFPARLTVNLSAWLQGKLEWVMADSTPAAIAKMEKDLAQAWELAQTTYAKTAQKLQSVQRIVQSFAARTQQPVSRVNKIAEVIRQLGNHASYITFDTAPSRAYDPRTSYANISRKKMQVFEDAADRVIVSQVYKDTFSRDDIIDILVAIDTSGKIKLDAQRITSYADFIKVVEAFYASYTPKASKPSVINQIMSDRLTLRDRYRALYNNSLLFRPEYEKAFLSWLTLNNRLFGKQAAEAWLTNTTLLNLYNTILEYGDRGALANMAFSVATGFSKVMEDKYDGVFMANYRNMIGYNENSIPTDRTSPVNIHNIDKLRQLYEAFFKAVIPNQALFLFEQVLEQLKSPVRTMTWELIGKTTENGHRYVYFPRTTDNKLGTPEPIDLQGISYADMLRSCSNGMWCTSQETHSQLYAPYGFVVALDEHLEPRLAIRLSSDAAVIAEIQDVNNNQKVYRSDALILAEIAEDIQKTYPGFPSVDVDGQHSVYIRQEARGENMAAQVREGDPIVYLSDADIRELNVNLLRSAYFTDNEQSETHWQEGTPERLKSVSDAELLAYITEVIDDYEGSAITVISDVEDSLKLISEIVTAVSDTIYGDDKRMKSTAAIYTEVSPLIQRVKNPLAKAIKRIAKHVYEGRKKRSILSDNMVNLFSELDGGSAQALRLYKLHTRLGDMLHRASIKGAHYDETAYAVFGTVHTFLKKHVFDATELGRDVKFRDVVPDSDQSLEAFANRTMDMLSISLERGDMSRFDHVVIPFLFGRADRVNAMEGPLKFPDNNFPANPILYSATNDRNYMLTGEDIMLDAVHEDDVRGEVVIYYALNAKRVELQARFGRKKAVTLRAVVPTDAVVAHGKLAEGHQLIVRPINDRYKIVSIENPDLSSSSESVALLQGQSNYRGLMDALYGIRYLSQADNALVEGEYDPNTGNTTLYMDNIDSAERAVFVAWHEAHHRGEDLFPELTMAFQEFNQAPMVKAARDAIIDKWDLDNVPEPMRSIRVAQELAAEISAAMRTGTLDVVMSSYGSQRFSGNVVMKALRALLDQVRVLLHLPNDAAVLKAIRRVDIAHDEFVNNGQTFKGSRNPLYKGNKAPSVSKKPVGQADGRVQSTRPAYRDTTMWQTYVNSDAGARNFMEDVRKAIGVGFNIPAKYDLMAALKTMPHRIQNRQERYRAQYMVPLQQAIDAFQSKHRLSAKAMETLNDQYRQLLYNKLAADRAIKFAAVHARLDSDDARTEREDMLFTIRDSATSPAVRRSLMGQLVSHWMLHGYDGDESKYFGINQRNANAAAAKLYAEVPLIREYEAAIRPLLRKAGDEAYAANKEAGVLGHADAAMREAYGFKENFNVRWMEDGLKNFVASDYRDLDRSLGTVVEDYVGKDLSGFMNPIQAVTGELIAAGRRAEENNTIKVLFNITKDFGDKLGLKLMYKNTAAEIYQIKDGTIAYHARRVDAGSMPYFVNGAQVVISSERDTTGNRNVALMNSIIAKFQKAPGLGIGARSAAKFVRAMAVGFTALNIMGYLVKAIGRDVMTGAFSYAVGNRGRILDASDGVVVTTKAAAYLAQAPKLFWFLRSDAITRAELAKKGGIYADLHELSLQGGLGELRQAMQLENAPDWLHELANGPAHQRNRQKGAGIYHKGSLRRGAATATAGLDFVLNQAYSLAHIGSAVLSLAAYKQAIKKGADPQQAAAESLQLFDPLIRGEKGLYWIESVLPFMRPYMSDLDRLIVEVGSTEFGAVKLTDKKALAKATLGLSLLAVGGFTTALMMAATMGDDDDGINRYAKIDGADATWRVYYYTDEEGNSNYMELPFGIGPMAWASGAAVARNMLGFDDAPESAVKVAAAVIRSTSPIMFRDNVTKDAMSDTSTSFATASPLVSAAYQAGANENAFGRKIWPEGAPRTGYKFDSGFKNTPQAYKDAAAWVRENMGADVYPETLRFLAQNTPYLNGVTSNIERVSKHGVGAILPVDTSISRYWSDKAFEAMQVSSVVWKRSQGVHASDVTPQQLALSKQIKQMDNAHDKLLDLVTRKDTPPAVKADLEARMASMQRQIGQWGLALEAMD